MHRCALMAKQTTVEFMLWENVKCRRTMCECVGGGENNVRM